MNTAVAKMRMAKAKDSVSPTSMTHAGTGRIITRITSMRPIANRDVGLDNP